MINRFKDKNHLIWNFTKKILVHCPNCNKQATVTDEEGCDVKLFCPSCHLCKTNNRKCYSINQNVRCSNCGKINYLYEEEIPKKTKVRTITCSCNHIEQFQPKYQEIIVSGVAKDGTDFYFNAKLWLSKSFKNEIFWAFNYEHLAYLKKYIEAKLRERNNRTHKTMLEVLPPFIKSAKNRDELLKIIAVLERK